MRRKPDEGDMLPMESQLFDARGNICFEGRCGDIDEGCWHGFEPLLFAGIRTPAVGDWHIAARDRPSPGGHSDHSSHLTPEIRITADP